MNRELAIRNLKAVLCNNFFVRVSSKRSKTFDKYSAKRSTLLYTTGQQYTQ